MKEEDGSNKNTTPECYRRRKQERKTKNPKKQKTQERNKKIRIGLKRT